MLLATLLGCVRYFLIRAWRDRASFASAAARKRPRQAEQRRFGLEEDPLAPIVGRRQPAPARRSKPGASPRRWPGSTAAPFQELAGRGLLPLRRDFTEDDCLRHLYRKAAGRSPEESAAATGFREQLFRDIAAAWMRVAYGHFDVREARHRPALRGLRAGLPGGAAGGRGVNRRYQLVMAVVALVVAGAARRVFRLAARGNR